MANSKLLLSRRGFIVASSVAAVGVPLFSGTMHRWLKASEQLSITSRNDAADKSYITAVDLSGTRKFEISVPTRCHGVAVHPRGNSQAVIFARRPGYLAFLIDFREGRVIKEFRAKEVVISTDTVPILLMANTCSLQRMIFLGKKDSSLFVIPRR